MAAEDYAENKNEQSSQIKGTRTNNGTSNNECDDLYKIHVSRIPTKFTEEAVQRILENKIGPGTVEDVVFIYKRPEDDADTDDANASSKESSKPKQNNRKEKKKERSDNDDNRINEAKTPETEHRGFGFVVLKDEPSYNKAVQLESVRGGRKATSSKQHTLYIRPYVQQTQESDPSFGVLTATTVNLTTMVLVDVWSKEKHPKRNKSVLPLKRESVIRETTVPFLMTLYLKWQ